MSEREAAQTPSDNAGHTAVSFNDESAVATSINDQDAAAALVSDQRRVALVSINDQGAAVTLVHDQSRARQQAVLVWLQKLPYAALIFQLFRFGLVGLTAAAIHFSIVVMLVQSYSLEPLVANIFAFTVSFQVSYFGHRRFTFAGTTALHSVAFPKLLSLQLVNFVANESLFYFFLSLHLPYQLALILVLGTLPLFTFIVSKWWVFKR